MAYPTINGTAAITTQSASTSIAATMPGSIAVGELLIAVVSCSLDTTQSAPPGWRVAIDEINDTNSANGMEVYKRVADGTEGGSATFSFGGSCDSVAIVFRVSGYDPYTEQGNTGTSTATSGSITAMTCPSITATDENIIIRIGATRQSLGLTNPGSHTDIGSGSNGSGTTNSTLGVCYAQQAVGGATGTAAFVSAAGADREYLAATMAIRPAAASVQSPSANTFLLRA